VSILREERAYQKGTGSAYDKDAQGGQSKTGGSGLRIGFWPVSPERSGGPVSSRNLAGILVPRPPLPSPSNRSPISQQAGGVLGLRSPAVAILPKIGKLLL
jgi:hypothetical protein